MNKLTITRPDDWHVHLRDDAAMAQVVPDTARYFGRAIVMPNLNPPIKTVSEALTYRERILGCLDARSIFDPLMVLYLTETTSIDEIRKAADSAMVHAVKLYPAGATTHSNAGVHNIEAVYPIFAAMQEVDLPLLIHGESIDPNVDVFDREAVFIKQHLEGITRSFPELRIVLEHITTEQAASFVISASDKVAATITVHHLLHNRNAIFQGGIRPHYYCLPILKRQRHQHALIEAATSGSAKFFLGTDSAPHPRGAKESSCGCAGIYTAHAAIELYAEVFEQADALDKLEGFASHYGADFYGLARNSDQITLTKENWKVPKSMSLGSAGELIPYRADETISWSVSETS